MIGFGSPADTMRESDVIVLMVSPLLAFRLVIDHNTEQRTEFPRFSTTTAPGSLGSARSKTSASQSLRRIDASEAILEPRRNELSGIPNRRQSMFRAFFGRRKGSGGRARAYAPRVASLAKAAFFVFLVPQFGFWPLRPLRAERPHSFRIFPKPGLWRGPQRCGCASLTSRLH